MPKLVMAGALAFMMLTASPASATRKPPKPQTAAELANAVAAAGRGCDDFELSDPSNTITVSGIPKPKSDGHCTIDGQQSTVSVFASKADLAAVLRAVPTLGCAFAKGTGVTVLRFVIGPTWTISTPSSVTGPKLAKALGAKKYVHRCKGD